MNEQKPELTLKGLNCTFRFTETSIVIFKRKKQVEELSWYDVQWQCHFGGRIAGRLVFWRSGKPIPYYAADSSVELAHTFSLCCPNPRTRWTGYERANEIIRGAKMEQVAKRYSDAQLKQLKTWTRISFVGLILMTLMTVFLFVFPMTDNQYFNFAAPFVTMLLMVPFGVKYDDFKKAPIRNFNAQLHLLKEMERS